MVNNKLKIQFIRLVFNTFVYMYTSFVRSTLSVKVIKIVKYFNTINNKRRINILLKKNRLRLIPLKNQPHCNTDY